MIHEVTTSLYLEKRQPKKDGSCGVKLRVGYNRKRKYYSIGQNAFLENEFDKIISGNCRGLHKELHIRWKAIENKARKVIKDLENFSFEGFEKVFFAAEKIENVASKDIFTHLEQAIERLYVVIKLKII